MNKIFDYTNLTLNELIEKISTARFFHLPKMVAEAFRKIPAGGSEPKYKVYSALLTQQGTNAPVATVLENTLGGEVVWSRVSVGSYVATLTGAFIENKTYINIGQNVTFGIGTGIINTTENTLNTIRVNSSSDFSGYSDDILTNTPIEIRVYN